MIGNKRYLLLKTGFIASLVILPGSVILFFLNASGSTGRIAMLMVAITSIFTGVSFFLQMKQYRKAHQGEK